MAFSCLMILPRRAPPWARLLELIGIVALGRLLEFVGSVALSNWALGGVGLPLHRKLAPQSRFGFAAQYPATPEQAQDHADEPCNDERCLGLTTSVLRVWAHGAKQRSRTSLIVAACLAGRRCGTCDLLASSPTASRASNGTYVLGLATSRGAALPRGYYPLVPINKAVDTNCGGGRHRRAHVLQAGWQRLASGLELCRQHAYPTAPLGVCAAWCEALHPREDVRWTRVGFDARGKAALVEDNKHLQ